MHYSIVLVVVVCCTVVHSLVFQHEMHRIESIRERKLREGTWEAFFKRTRMPGEAGFQPEEDYQDLTYVANIQMGTPVQDKFMVVVDTGSSNLWVPDASCSKAGCVGKHHYNASASSTYVKNGKHFSIAYGTGSASGYLGQDNFCFGNTGLCYSKQVFGQATQVAKFFADTHLDGICGMAFQSIAIDNVVPPFMNVMPHLDNPYFTVWLTKDGDVEGKPGGRITYGALDIEHCERDVTWVPVSKAQYYQFTMSGASINGHSLKGGEVISDTGTSMIAGPEAAINTIIKQMPGGHFDRSLGIYFIGCDTKAPSVTFTIHGQNYTVESKNYIVPTGISTICMLGFEVLDLKRRPKYGLGVDPTPPDWILGDCFIRQYCNVYDPKNKRVGLARATK